MDDLAGSGLSITELATAAAILVGGVLLALLLRRVVQRGLRGSDSEPRAGDLVARLVQLVVVAAAVVYALNVLGVRITPVLGALGIGGIAVALAVQSVLTNAIAALLLQIRRPFRRGDQIRTNDLEGRVLGVNWRTVRLLTFDGNDVLVPAATVLEAPITNYTRRESRRTELAVGVDYDTDLDAARGVILAAAASVAGVHESPEPEAWVLEFGDNAITIVLRYWHDSPVADLWRVRSEVAVALKTALDAEGMVIAFPQRVLHLAPTGNELTVRRS